MADAGLNGCVEAGVGDGWWITGVSGGRRGLLRTGARCQVVLRVLTCESFGLTFGETAVVFPDPCPLLKVLASILIELPDPVRQVQVCCWGIWRSHANSPRAARGLLMIGPLR